MRLTVSHDFLPKAPTLRTSRVMDDFGIDFEQGQHVVAEGLDLDIRAGELALFTGPSGSGKSSLMRAVLKELGSTQRVVNLDDLDLGDRPLVDALPGAVEDGMRLLSQCGLGEAHLMLRTPDELSEGQRYRFRLALAISKAPDWVVADEFTATLDRTLAKVISHSLRKLCDGRRHAGQPLGLLLATTHEDVVEDLAADVHVRCDLNGAVVVTRADGAEFQNASEQDGGKKKTLFSHRRLLDQRRYPSRLAVLRSVALPVSRDRAEQVHYALVARPRTRSRNRRE